MKVRKSKINIRTTLVVAFFTFVCLESFSQTNFFPSSGNVGIGITPTYKLDVYGPANEWKARFQGSDGYITLGPANPEWAHIYTDRPNFIFNQNVWSVTGGFSAYSTANLDLQTNGLTRMTILSSNGNVGIGLAAAPTAKLQVAGPTTGTGPTIHAAGGGDVVLNSGGSLFLDGNYSYSSGNYIRPSGGNNTQGFYTSGLQRMRINADGKVGIGISSPAAALDVVGAGNDAVDLKVTGRIKTGDSWGNGGVWLNNASTMFIGQLGSSDLGLFNNEWRVVVKNTGNVGIGTANPDQKLTVNGKIHGKEVIIDLSVPAPDYVFETSYDLRSLDEVKAYIDANKHLPEVPSGKEMETKGVNVGEMEMMLLKKVEELTLYAIEQDKNIKALMETSETQMAMIKILKSELESQKKIK